MFRDDMFKEALPYKELPHNELHKDEYIVQFTSLNDGFWKASIDIRLIITNEPSIYSFKTNEGREWDLANGWIQPTERRKYKRRTYHCSLGRRSGKDRRKI